MLVVEDEPLIRMDAVAMLEEAGLHVVEFDRGAAAASYLEDHEPEVAAIFTDINLKGELDGVELARFAARVAPGVMLVVTSGRYHDRPGLPRGARFMPKPWLPLDVLTAMQDAVAGRRASPECDDVHVATVR